MSTKVLPTKPLSVGLFDATSLVIPGAEFGGGGVVGFMIGYGLKKIAKLLLMVFSVLVPIQSMLLAAL